MNAYALLGRRICRPGTSTPKGRFVLRADSIRPYSLGGEAAAIQRTAQLRTLREAKSLPYRLRSFRFSLCTLPGGLGHQRMRTMSVALLSGDAAAQGVYYGF